MSVATAPAAPARAHGKDSVWRRLVRGLGWTLITAGVLILLFVVYQLFVTNLITDRAQDGLRQDLAERFRAPATADAPKPLPGDALGIIRIPSIALNAAFVEGTSPEDLKKGPGHYPDTPMPGEPGNVGIAGHRTTYGKPFWPLDEVERGDEIFVRTVEGRFVYRVTWKRVVTPAQSEVLDATRRPSLTLTTCHPRFSAAQRLIVRAVLVEAPAGVEVAA